MGSSSKTTKTAQTTTGTSTTMPNAPSWATNALQDYTNKVEQFGNSNASQYVAPLTALQQQAATGAANLGSTWQPGLQQAQNDASSVYNAATPQIGSTATTTPTGYGATGYTGTGYNATGYTGTGYNATGYNAANVGSQGYRASQAGSTGYNAALDSAAQIDTGDIQRLMSPYTDAVVNTTLAGYDKQAGQSMAALKAAAAANNAFAGSRYGIEEGEQQASSDLGRAQTEAGLRQADYAQALSGATTDAGYRQQTGLANQAALNSASEFGANAYNSASLANAASRNSASQFGANAANTAALANQGAANTASAYNASAQNAASEYGASASNASNAALAAAQNAASAYGAQAQNAANEYTAGAQNTANQFNAGAQNTGSMFNASALNNTATQNANLSNDALARQLSAAGLIGNMSTQASANALNDITAQSQQGAIQQQQDAQQRTAGLSQLQALAALLQQGQYGLLTGSTGTSSGTLNSNVKTTDNPGILGTINAGLQTGSKLAALFG